MSRTHSRPLSWDEICEEAFGECDLKPWEFYEFTLSEYQYRRAGIRKYRRVQLRQDYQHIRMLAYHSILPYLDKKDKKKKLDELIPDIYEEKKVEDESLADTYKKLIKRYKDAGLLN